MIPRRHRQLPPIVPTPLDDIWEVLVPAARTNEITNPSLETATTGYTAGAGSLARSTTQQYHGAYSAAYTPSAATTDGFYYTMTSTVALRAISCKFLGAAGVPYALAYASTAPAELVTYTFIATGRWQWIWLYVNETSATSRRIYFRKNGSASTAIFYVDGVQSEVLASAAETVSTYIDGDQLGLLANQVPPAYFWNGTPHASTSTRSGLTRAGGQVVKFKDYGFFLSAIIGLGLAVPQNVGTEYARADGGYDDYTRKPTRQFSVVGNFHARNYQELRDMRGGLAATFDRDLIGLDQELILRHYAADACGNAISDIARIACKYESGLAGNVNNQVGETTPITFTQSFPIVTGDNEAAASLNVQTAISNGLRILQRSASGVWSNLGAGANNNVWSLLYASDGKLYAGGEFTSIGGVAANRIAYWDGAAWNAMGTGQAGVGSNVTSIVEGPDGSIYAAGDGTDFGGVANTARLGKWTPGSATWSSITGAGSANNDVTSLKIAPDGSLIAGGDFTTINGVAAARIANRSVAGTWTAYGAGIPTAVAVYQGVVIAPDGNPVVAEVSAVGVKKWNGATWDTIGAANNTTERLIYGPDGILYAGGSFTSIGGVTAGKIAKYNGVAWQPLGTGVDSSSGSEFVSALAVLPDGTLLVGGFFDIAGGITTVDNIARWNGSAWVYLDVDIAWGAVSALALKRDGTLAMGGQGATSTGVAAATTTVTNTGTARAYPTLTIKGPTSGTSRIYQITNPTTGRNVFLDYTINAGETATFVFQPDNLQFYSDFTLNLAGTILPGSNEADFFLQPGANTISFFSADSTVTATLRWRTSFASLDDVP